MEKNPFFRPKLSEMSRFFSSDGHGMWKGPSGQLVLVFVPSISAVPVQRNGARRGSQCFSYGRVQNSNFKSLPLIWGASGTPSPMVIQTRLNILRNTHKKHFRNFDFDQWGMLKKREKTTFLNFGIRGKNPIRPRFGRRFFSR